MLLLVILRDSTSKAGLQLLNLPDLEILVTPVNSGLQHAIEDNTDAVSNNSDDTSDAADEVSEALQNVIKKLNDNAMDWVEVAMDRLDRITSRYTDLAESDYSHYTKAQSIIIKLLKIQIKKSRAAKESISVYKRKSEEVANNGEVSKYLTPALKKKSSRWHY